MFVTKLHISSSILLVSLLSISLCLEESSILLLPFKTKGLQKEEDEEEWSEPYQSDDEDWPYDPSTLVFNSSQFINKWFYNGLNVEAKINKYSIQSYLNLENSKMSIEKCNLQKVMTPNRGDFYYKPINSDTFEQKEVNLGNDVFNFYGDLGYKKNIQIGEKGNGLNFYFKENNEERDLCLNFGLNMDKILDKTNLINQLKKKNYINDYLWTLKYLVEEDGIIILGTKPHFYQNDTYLMSQYCEMKAIPNQSPETAWSFKIDEIRIKPKDSDDLILSDKKVDFLPDRGLIIGTNEYKKKIDELVFNDLIQKGICFCEENKFSEIEKGTNDIYYIYYCDRKKFIGNKYTIQKSYFNSFPSLEFYIKEINMTFNLVNDHLFHEIYNRSYFLVIFKKSDNTDNIWKLGEPFFSHFQFTFDQDKKMVSFYNPVMPKISNEDYLKQIRDKNKNNDGDKTTLIIIIIASILTIIIFSVGGYFIGKKLNEIRKRRANELKDDFDYTASENINGAKPEDNNNTEQEEGKDVLGIN